MQVRKDNRAWHKAIRPAVMSESALRIPESEIKTSSPSTLDLGQGKRKRTATIQGEQNPATTKPQNSQSQKKLRATVSGLRSEPGDALDSSSNTPGLGSPQKEKLKLALGGVQGLRPKVINMLRMLPIFQIPELSDQRRSNASVVKAPDFNSVPGVLYVPTETSLASLLEDKNTKLNDIKSSFYTQVPTILRIPKNPSYRCGVFKMALEAQSNEIVIGNSTRICLKQIIHKGSTQELKPADVGSQLSKLIVEVGCLIWGKALLDLVYEFISSAKVTSDFHITVPMLRFVEFGLFISDDRTQVYLVEEYLDVGSKDDQKFFKYINNSSAKPLLSYLPDNDYKDCARFLSFAQHIQFVKTKEMVYTSDFQGNDLCPTLSRKSC